MTPLAVALVTAAVSGVIAFFTGYFVGQSQAWAAVEAARKLVTLGRLSHAKPVPSVIPGQVPQDNGVSESVPRETLEREASFERAVERGAADLMAYDQKLTYEDAKAEARMLIREEAGLGPLDATPMSV